MTLEKLVGLHMLTGIEYTTQKVANMFEHGEAQGVAFVLDNITYIALEDENDGYRSACRELIAHTRKMVSNVFEPLAVYCVMDNDNEKDVLHIWDIKTNRQILSVGTDYSDGYYPCFVNDYRPGNMFHNDRMLNTVDLTSLKIFHDEINLIPNYNQIWTDLGEKFVSLVLEHCPQDISPITRELLINKMRAIWNSNVSLDPQTRGNTLTEIIEVVSSWIDHETIK